MIARFPDNPMLKNNFAPLLAECDAPDLVVEGELPQGLRGTLYRNGPNPMYPPLGRAHHWFLGEGMVHAIRFEEGKVAYRNRWVRTGQYLAQREAGHRLVDTAFGTPRASGGETLRNNVANTNIVHHAGRLLALDEGSPPVAMDPLTLDTQGSWDFGAGFGGPMTAHPKFDPASGEMCFFGYMAAGPGTPEVSYSVVGRDGALLRSDMFRAPYASMMHDFVLTDTHVIFPVFPATIDVARIMRGGPLIAWDPSVATMIGIMGRDEDVSAIRWFEGDPCYVYHPMNAFTEREEGRTCVVVDVMKYSRVPLFPDATGTRPAPDLAAELGSLVRWRFNLDRAQSGWSEEALSELGGEFPRFDERFAGLHYRHGYYASRTLDPAEGAPFDTLVHVDLASGERRQYLPGPGCFVHEPVFVPRSAHAVEGDGFLLSLVYDGETRLSDVIVLDTSDISHGPLARVKLPVRVPFGFHGNWVANA